MSTVLPPAAGVAGVAGPAGPVVVLLVLLLERTPATAIAAKAAIADVRLMIFLSSFELVLLPRSALTGLVRAQAARHLGGGRSAGSRYGGRAGPGSGRGAGAA